MPSEYGGGPARSERDSKAGGGWGAPLKADFGPVDIRRPGLLFNGLLARSNHSRQTSPAGPPVGGFGRLVDGTSARATAAPITGLRPRPVAPAAPPAAAARSARPVSRRAAAPQLRTITHVDLRSVARVSAVFYGIVLIVMVVASVLLWVVADAAGAVHSIDHSVQSLFGLKQYSLHPTTIALYGCVAGVVVAVTGTLVNLLAASVYNLVSDVVGGLRVKVSDT